MKIRECAECMQHFFDNPYILEACASVALDNGKTTKELFVMYISYYHNSSHMDEVLDAVQ